VEGVAVQGGQDPPEGTFAGNRVPAAQPYPRPQPGQNTSSRNNAGAVQGIGHWPNIPHVHFEIMDDLGKVIANNHVPLAG
ncbi:hypothetical protein, partial [Micromonospora sp. DT4]|uniref:hypothetical protein n=1 Tax=Micromonospora sp. DT4 TaxID=3393438 RepID=UPI003CE7DAD6